jgi:two-component system chemotaxis sensor kinase CheA
MSQPEAEFFGIFRDEANERLESMSATLLAIEEGRGPANAIDGLFRDAHTIKGGAGMLGLDEIAAIAHAVEDVLADARDAGQLAAMRVEPLLRAGDALRNLVNGEKPANVAAIIADLALQPVAGPAAAIGTSDSTGAGTAEASAPSGRSESESPLRLVRERRSTAPGDVPPAGPEERRRGREGPSGRFKTVRVPAEKLDALLDLVGETVLHRQRLGHMVASGDQEQRELLSDELDLGDRLLGALQDAAVQTRTLPFRSITGPFPRALRDIALAEGKEVDLEIDGLDTELDRVILEGLSEPLVHMLRNAVAHGIESPDQRVAAHKAARGRVVLAAQQRGGMVAVSVSDDGRGVSQEVVAQAERDGSLAAVLARPGFSTRSEVSALAGRGVGLDAVAAHVEAFGGTLQIESEPGAGMSVTLLLPLTLALLDVLLLERGSHVFGIPMASVQEAVAVTETLSLTGRKALELRGTSIPFSDMAELLGLDAPPLPARAPAIVVSAAGRRVALACDRLIGESEVVVKDLGRLLGAVTGFVGAAILGDGRVALLLDPASATSLRRPARVPSPEATDLAGPGHARTLLVVEDSFMVRELQRSILEAAGYRVEIAKHGRDALERLGANRDIELVVTDLDMPEMDGLALTEAIRASEEWRSLPVIVVTSRASEDDRRRGVEAGADAYMVKDSFDQHALLETVARMIGE